MPETKQYVLYFDGVCGLCNSTVDILLKLDRHKKIMYSPLQSAYARDHLSAEWTRDLNSLVFQSGQTVYCHSAAVIEMGRALGGVYSIVVIGYVIPKFIRNSLYDFIARYRYAWFGKKDTCRIPTPEERARFLL